MQQSEIKIIDQPEPAACLLQGNRIAIVEALREPGTAASVARQLRLGRQKVAYHVRTLERQGLLDHVEDRRKGNCVERVVQASARHYLIAPELLAGLALSQEQLNDQFSSAYQVAAANRIAATVARMRHAAGAEGLKLATYTAELGVSFASPREQREFVRGLQHAIEGLLERFHQPHAQSARHFQLTHFLHPATEAPQ